MAHDLNAMEEALRLKIDTPCLRDKEESYWMYNNDTELYHICDVQGHPFPPSKAFPGSTRAQIDKLYGPTELADPNEPIRKSVGQLFQNLRNGFLID